MEFSCPLTLIVKKLTPFTINTNPGEPEEGDAENSERLPPTQQTYAFTDTIREKK